MFVRFRNGNLVLLLYSKVFIIQISGRQKWCNMINDYNKIDTFLIETNFFGFVKAIDRIDTKKQILNAQNFKYKNF